MELNATDLSVLFGLDTGSDEEPANIPVPVTKDELDPCVPVKRRPGRPRKISSI